MIAVWRYTTHGCVRVWKLYHLKVWLPPLAAAAIAIPCGGYVAGRLLPDAPVPREIPRAERALPPGWAYAPLPDDAAVFLPEIAPVPWGYEPGAEGSDFPRRRAAPGAPRQLPGPSAGGGASPDVSRVVPNGIQPPTSGHPYLPPSALIPGPGFPDAAIPQEPVPVPGPASTLLMLLIGCWALAFFRGPKDLRPLISLGATLWLAILWPWL